MGKELEKRICAYDKCAVEFRPKRNRQVYHKPKCRQAAWMDRKFAGGRATDGYSVQCLRETEDKQSVPSLQSRAMTSPAIQKRKKRPSDFLKRPALKPEHIGTIRFWAESHPDSPSAAEIEKIMSRLMTPITKLRKESQNGKN